MYHQAHLPNFLLEPSALKVTIDFSLEQPVGGVQFVTSQSSTETSVSNRKRSQVPVLVCYCWLIIFY